MADTDKDIAILQRRFLDLADKCYQQNVYTFTGFLGESDQDAFFAIQGKTEHVPYTLFGGNELCERKMLRFGSEEQLGFTEEFPICLVRITPLLQKFADELTHRDFLGALMNLGIDRTTLGDIFVQENQGYVFCTQTIAPFITENLDQVKHTHVKCAVADASQELKKEEPVPQEVLVSSERIDGVIAKLFNLSRTQSLELFRGRQVHVNGRLCENNSYLLKKEDAVSVRGYGKFLFDGILRETRKGKECVSVRSYIRK